MKLGFTGTRAGLTPQQQVGFGFYLGKLVAPPSEFHHGACLGADAEAVGFIRHAYGRQVQVEAHPGDWPPLTDRASLAISNKVHPCRPMLIRNQAIVDACDVLVACPKGPEQMKGSGTWATIRYARKAGKPIVFLWPEGPITETRENFTPEGLA